MLGKDLRQQVVDRFKRAGPANHYDAFKCLETLGGLDISENVDEIIQIWESPSKWTSQKQRNQRAPPTPSASSAATSSQWTPPEERRPLKIPPQCTDEGHANKSVFFIPADGIFWPAGSKPHNGPGSYITSTVLSNAGVNFEEDGVIRLPWKPQQMHDSQPEQLYTTLFNVVSREEAASIGMTGRTGKTDCDILYGEDFHHPWNQQYKAQRESLAPISPCVPTPPTHIDSPAPSIISVTRSDPPEVQPGVQNISPSQYSLTFKGGPYELSMNAPNSDPHFLSFAKDVFQLGTSPTAARLSTFNENNPPRLITGPVDSRSSAHMANPGTDIQYPMAGTVSQTGYADPAGLEHRHKRKAAEEVAPEVQRRQRRMDIDSLLS